MDPTKLATRPAHDQTPDLPTTLDLPVTAGPITPSMQQESFVENKCPPTKHPPCQSLEAGNKLSRRVEDIGTGARVGLTAVAVAGSIVTSIWAPLQRMKHADAIDRDADTMRVS